MNNSRHEEWKKIMFFFCIKENGGKICAWFVILNSFVIFFWCSKVSYLMEEGKLFINKKIVSILKFWLKLSIFRDVSDVMSMVSEMLIISIAFFQYRQTKLGVSMQRSQSKQLDISYDLVHVNINRKLWWAQLYYFSV